MMMKRGGGGGGGGGGREDLNKEYQISTSLPNSELKNWWWSSTDGSDGNSTSKKHQVFIIGVAGGSASGKTSVCKMIYENLKNFSTTPKLHIISLDCFYKSLEEKDLDKVHDYNFDHPDAFDWDELFRVLTDLKSGKPVQVPNYDFVTHKRTKTKTEITGADIILLEGILIFYESKIRHLMNMKIFVDTDADTRLVRRIRRDIKFRGRELEGVLHQYSRFVKPAFDEYIMPTKKHADVIIPRGADNHVAIGLITHHLKQILERKLDECSEFTVFDPESMDF